MSKTATLPPSPMTAATDFEKMTATVLLIGEWLVKQQQQFKQQQSFWKKNSAKSRLSSNRLKN
jgi:hypothetical protein